MQHGNPPGHGSDGIKRVARAIGFAGFANGATEPAVGPFAPEIQRRIGGVSDRTFSFAWSGWPIGMFGVSLVGHRLLHRLGVRRLIALGATVYWTAFALIGAVHHPAWLFLATLLTGVGNGMFDVAWARVAPWVAQRRESEGGPRSGLVNQLQNAFFSAGSLVASVAVIITVGLGVSLGVNLVLVSGLGLAITLLWTQRSIGRLPAGWETGSGPVDLAPPVDPAPPRRVRRGAPGQLRRAGLLAFCAALPVGIAYAWSSQYLQRLGLGSVEVRFGTLAFTLFELVTRLAVGASQSRRARRWLPAASRWFDDSVRVAVLSGFTGLTGIGLISGVGTAPAAIAGFALLAVGTALLGPEVQDVALKLWPDRGASAAALVTRYSYLALVLGPVIVGPLSTALGTTTTPTSLRWAFLALAALFVTVIALARSLRVRPARTSDETG